MTLAFQSSTVSSTTAVADALPVPYPASIAAGDILVLIVGTKAFGNTITTPSGWLDLGWQTNGTTAAGTDTGSVKIQAFARSAAGTETGNLTVTITGAVSSYGVMYRYTRAAGSTVAVTASTGTDAAAGTGWSVAYIADPGITTDDHLIVGGVWSTDAASTVSASAVTATGVTLAAISPAAGDQNPRITTGSDLGGNTAHTSCTAGVASASPTWTHTQTLATNNAGSATIVRLREVSSTGKSLVAATGFEHGSLSTSGNAGSRLFDSVSNPAASSILTDSPRSGARYLQMVQSSATYARVSWTTATLGATRFRAVRFYIRFPVAPTNETTEVAGTDTASGGGWASIEYRKSTAAFYVASSLGISGDATVTSAVGSWHLIEYAIDSSANPWVVYWRVNGVDQTSYTSEAIAAVNLDWSFFGSLTAVDRFTADYDDIAVSASSIDYPIGHGKVQLLKVDSAGTPALIAGAAADSMAAFTANATVAATFNAANIRDALTEVPPTTDGSASGVAQRTSGAGNAVELPMETYTLQTSETVNGARLLVPGWHNSATTSGSFLGVRAYNGTDTEAVLQDGTIDPALDNTATSGWICRMLPPGWQWTQAKLDALVARLGYSTDIAPVPGAHAVYAEVDVAIPAPSMAPRRNRAAIGALLQL